MIDDTEQDDIFRADVSQSGKHKTFFESKTMISDYTYPRAVEAIQQIHIENNVEPITLTQDQYDGLPQDADIEDVAFWLAN